MSYGDCDIPLRNSDDYLTDAVPPNIATPPNLSIMQASLLSPQNHVSLFSTQDGPDWNKEFQESFQMTIEAENDHEKSLERSVHLRQLCSRFAETASRIGVQIIEELVLPLNRRTIRSVSKEAGGVAGGEKYVAGGIFFKLSRDWKRIYGGDGNAMKAAEHEIKGGMAYLDCRITNLHLPLMALIRYRGHCLIAESIIPIGDDSLVYGSRDGGVSIFASSNEFNEKMRLAAIQLNLKAHRVWTKDKSKSVLLHGPIDLEGHLGKDGRFYVIDTARVFPPIAPFQGSLRGSYLYKLFRPEFVRSNPTPLSSDAFSRFGRDSELEHNQEVLDATIRLESRVIPEFAKYLDQRYNDINVDGATNELAVNESDEDLPAVSLRRNPSRQLEELSNLTAEMHLRGINIRYSLAIQNLLKNSLIKKLLLTEVVARSTKHLLDDTWRGIDSVVSDVYLKETTSFVNSLYSKTPQSIELWNSIISIEVEERFKVHLRNDSHKKSFQLTIDPSVSPNNSISSTGSNLRGFEPIGKHSESQSDDEELNREGSLTNEDDNNNIVYDGRYLRNNIDEVLLFFRLCQLAGVEVDFPALSRSPTLSNHPDIVLHSDSEPNLFLSEEDNLTKEWKIVSAFLSSDDKLICFPSNCIKSITTRTKYLNRISYEEGTALTRLALTKPMNERFELLNQANRKFQECLEIKPDDTRALFNWAFSLRKQAEATTNSILKSQLWKEAFSKYERCVVLKPNDWRAFCKWGTDLSQAAKYSPLKDTHSLYYNAIEKFDSTLKILRATSPSSSSNLFHPLYNSGNVRLNLARLKMDDLKSQKTVRSDKFEKVNKECAELLQEAIQNFQEASKIESQNVNVLLNLAISLSTLARIESSSNSSSAYATGQPQINFAGIQKDRLYNMAYVVFQKAIHLVPTSIDIYYGWGNSLFRHALALRESPLGDDVEAFKLLCEAAFRYHCAIVISQKQESPYSRDLFINFGNVLILMIKLSARKQVRLNAQNLGCLEKYIRLSEQPNFIGLEANSIYQVLSSFKKYIPRGVLATLPDFSKSLESSASQSHRPQTLSENGPTLSNSSDSSSGATPREMSLRSQSNNQKKPKKSNLNETNSNTSGDRNNDENPSNHPQTQSTKRKTKELPSETGGSPSGDKSVQRKKSKNSLQSSSDSISHAVKDSLKKSLPKIANSPTSPKIETDQSSHVDQQSPQRQPVTQNTSPLPNRPENPLSPTGTSEILEVAQSDSVVSQRQKSQSISTTSRIKQRLGSFFGLTKSKTHHSSTQHIAIANQNSNIVPPIQIQPASGESSPKSTDLSVENSTNNITKSRSKSKPARSLSYAEELAPRKNSTSSTKSTDSKTPLMTSSKSSKTARTFDQSTNPEDSKNSKSLNVKDNSDELDYELIPTQVTRFRRKSDADSIGYAISRRKSASTIIRPAQTSLSASNPSIKRAVSPPINITTVTQPLTNSTQSPKEPSSLDPFLSAPSPTSTSSNSPVLSQQSSSFGSTANSSTQASGISSNSPTSTSASSTSPMPIITQKTIGNVVMQSAPVDDKKRRSLNLSKGKAKKSHTKSNSSVSPSEDRPKDQHTKEPKTGKRKSSRKSGKSLTQALPVMASSIIINSAQEFYPDKLNLLYSFDETDKTIKEGEFAVRGVLGTSRSGLVFIARRKDTDFAMKVRQPTSIHYPLKLTPIYDHPFIVSTKFIFTTQDKLVFAFGLIRGPLLFEYVIKSNAVRPNQPEKKPISINHHSLNQAEIDKVIPKLDHLVFRNVAAQLVSAFSYLIDELATPYRDFKPQNVLINDSGNIILTVHNEEDDSTINFARADVSYLSPEIVIKIRERRAVAGVLGKGTSKTLAVDDDQQNKLEDSRASWWSLGMFLYVITTGINPFSSNTSSNMFSSSGSSFQMSDEQLKIEENVLKKKIFIPNHLGKLSSLLSGLLDRDITTRLCSGQAVRNHPYFSNIDWNKLTNLEYHPPFLPNISSTTAISSSSKRNMTATGNSLADSMNSSISSFAGTGTTPPQSFSSLSSLSSLDTSLDLSSTAGQIALMKTIVAPDLDNQLEGNAMFIQNTHLMGDELGASSSDDVE